jgi:uncharacterized membrane protein YhaH (DUF805 family)
MRTDYGDNRISRRLAFRPFIDAFQFHGRSTRTEVVSFWLLGIVANAMSLAWGDPSSILARTLPVAWAVAWNWPWLPLLVRRLHDQDRSGWRAAAAFAPLLLFWAAWVAAAPVDSGGFVMSLDWLWIHQSKHVAWTAATLVSSALFILSAVVTFVLYLLPGTAGQNRFGPDPRLASPAKRVPAKT